MKISELWVQDYDFKVITPIIHKNEIGKLMYEGKDPKLSFYIFQFLAGVILINLFQIKGFDVANEVLPRRF